MRRPAALVLLLAIAAAAPADVVFMKDGRRIEGEVTDKGDQYAVKTKFGTVHVKKAEVERIELPPAREYAERAKGLAGGDAEGHFRLGEWCRGNGLPDEAAAEFRKALEADPGHEGAHKALGHARAGDRWVSGAELLAEAEGVFGKGDVAGARARVLPLTDAAVAASLDVETRRRALDLATLTALATGHFPDARAAVERWAECVPAAEKAAAAAWVKIVSDTADGRYAVRAEELDAAEAAGEPALTPGRQPLWDARVRKLALRAVALRDVQRGKDAAEKAEAAETTDPGLACELYDEAEDCYDRADRVVPGVSGAHRTDMVRRLVPLVFTQAALADREQAAINPRGQKYEMEQRPNGKLRFTADGLAKFEEHRRAWTRWAAQLESCLKIVAKLDARYPGEVAPQKASWDKLKNIAEVRFPEMRKYFEETARQYK